MMGSKNKVAEILRDTWYLWGTLVLCLIAALILHAREKTNGRNAPGMRQASQAGFAAKMPEPAEPRTAEDRTRELIAAYRTRVIDNPRDEEAPVLLSAMGNLARQKLGDYEKAVEYYEWALQEYPDWKGINRVYVNLAQCYSQLGRFSEETTLYMKMQKAFPKDSAEGQFAKAQLER